MDLFEKISEDIKDAMRSKDKVRLEALRGVKKEFLEAKTSKDGNGELPDEVAIKILQKMIKQRRDSADIYKSQDRPELAEKELAEVVVIEKYLPKQLTEDELEERLKEIIGQVSASTSADMGKVMAVASKSLVGLASGKAISDAVKKLLA